MDRINSPDGQFHNGDPTTGQRGTRITAEWLNGVQEELIHVIEAGGRAQPDFANVSQLLAAIRAVSQAEARAAFQRGAQPTGTAAGSENDLAVSTAPPVDELLDGLELRVRAGSANTRRQVTIRIGDLPPVAVTKLGGRALAIADIAGPGHELILRYNADTQCCELLNPRAVAGDAVAISGSSHFDFLNCI